MMFELWIYTVGWLVGWLVGLYFQSHMQYGYIGQDYYMYVYVI